MLRHSLAALAAAVAFSLAAPALAQNVHIGTPTGAISTAVKVPAGSEMIYVSGATPKAITPAADGKPADYGDTKTQTISVLENLKATLEAQGYTFGDVVMMRIYLVGDPKKGGVMDREGMMAAYTQYFGTAAQPNKPARVTIQIAALGSPTMLCEIEVQAARKPK